MSLANRYKFITILVLLLTAACQPQAQEVVELPTLASLPTVTPSHTPTETPIPTWTFTPTNTDTPTITPTFTPSLTFTPSVTFTPPASSTPQPSATTPPTDTPPPSTTPLPPVITAFGANVPSATANAQILLAWVAEAEVARIETLNQQGNIINSQPVPATGQIPITVPSDAGNQLVFRLVVSRGGVEISASVPLPITCAITWFFTEDTVTSNVGCPSEQPQISDGAYQRFEDGFMIYLEDRGDRIYGFVDNGNVYTSHKNDWSGDDDDLDDDKPDDDDDDNEDLRAPEEEFNWMYYERDAPNGDDWHDVIGWATTVRNENDLTYQAEANTGAFYVDDGMGGLYRLSGGDSGTWTRIR